MHWGGYKEVGKYAMLLVRRQSCLSLKQSLLTKFANLVHRAFKQFLYTSIVATHCSGALSLRPSVIVGEAYRFVL